jgi:hypothetical protein
MQITRTGKARLGFIESGHESHNKVIIFKTAQGNVLIQNTDITFYNIYFLYFCWSHKNEFYLNLTSFVRFSLLDR